MRVVVSTLGQSLILLAVASTLGLGVNAMRGKDRINLARAYFQRPTAEHPVPPADPCRPPATTTQPGQAEHGFQEIGLEQALELFQHKNTAAGLYVFVDARADQPYEAGHIPGAVQCDYYRLESYLPDMLPRCAAAEKIIVYCNGGDCEDSLHVCGELLKFDIPRAAILLFKGGWQAWSQANLPYATGRE